MTKDSTIMSNKIAKIIAVICVIVGIAYYYTDRFKNLDRTLTELSSPNRESLLQKEILSKVTVSQFNLEIFPVQLMYLKNSQKGLFDCEIFNSTIHDIDYEVVYGFTELNEPEKDIIRIASGKSKTLSCAPFLNKLLSLKSPISTTLQLKIQELNGSLIYEKSFGVKINPSDEMPWMINKTDYSFLIASWVTPKNSTIEYLAGKTTEEYGKNVPLPENMNDEQFNDIVKAVFNSVREEGISYLNSTINFGEGFTQRVRLPENSIKNKTANCIDGSVLLASIFENIGLLPYIVIVPGHAFVAVARPGKEESKIFIETTLLGRSKLESFMTLETTYSAAIKKGYKEYNDACKKNNQLKIIDIRECRKAKIFPI